MRDFAKASPGKGVGTSSLGSVQCVLTSEVNGSGRWVFLNHSSHLRLRSLSILMNLTINRFLLAL